MLAGDPGNISLIGAPEPLIEMPRVYPNLSTGATVQVEWKGPSQGPVALGVYDMIGNEVLRQVINRRSVDAVLPSNMTLHRPCTSSNCRRATLREAYGGWFAEGHRMNGFSVL